MADLILRGVTTASGKRMDLGIRATFLVDPSDCRNPRVIDASGLIILPGLVDLHTHLREPAPYPAETIATGTAAAARGGYTAVFAMANTDPVTDTADKVRDLRRRAQTASAEVIPVGAITRGLDGTKLSDIDQMHREGVTYFSDDGHCVMNADLMRQALHRIGTFGGVAAQHAQDHNLAGNTAWLPDGPHTDGPHTDGPHIPQDTQVAPHPDGSQISTGVPYLVSTPDWVSAPDWVSTSDLVSAPDSSADPPAMPTGISVESSTAQLRMQASMKTDPSTDRSPMPTRMPEDSPSWWPRAAESVIVARDAQLALDTGTHVHICHVSTAESVEVVRWAKSRGIPLTAEVTPHHLLLGSDLLASHDTRYKVNPPLRSHEDRDALRQGLADGTLDVVATDHAPHLPSDKDKPFPQAKPGMVGLEYALAVVIDTLVNTGLMDWADVADRLSHAPARIGQIAGHQGRPLLIGELATVTLIDPTRTVIVDKDSSLSLGRNNPYDGMDLPDPVLATFWQGRSTYWSPILG